MGAQAAGASAVPTPTDSTEATNGGSSDALENLAASPAPVLTPTAATSTPAPGSTPASSTASPAATTTASPAATTALAAAPSAAQAIEGAHYLVTSPLGVQKATLLLARLEALYSLFNKVFRFDEGRLPGKLVVREFGSKADFDAYLLKLSGETRGDFVYVHYTSPQKRELLVFDKPQPDFSASLAHQAFVQYIKAYIQNPPLWLLDGFAILFEDVRFAPGSATPVIKENLAWLPTVKGYAAKGTLMPLDRLLSAGPSDAKANIDVFYPESWAFVSFLIGDREGDYTRLLWETVATLEPQASLDANQAAFAKRLSDWYGMDATQKALDAYIAGRMTYPDLLSSGIDLYSKKDFDKATAAFEEADGIDPTGYVAPYYLGLIAYEKGDWATADGLYRAALTRGCDAATATYAIGLNEIARGLVKEGAADLAKAAAASPDRYKAKVDDILARLGSQ
ncbi:MAG TPA: hypothetical protein VMV44_07375 [Rectinemataceae bacterium]|nr:hypothetical protein [Rectinemataceae bacterium]